MKAKKPKIMLSTEFKGFNGVEFSIYDKNDPENTKTSKTINLISALDLVENLKDHLRAIANHASIMNFYRHYGDNIEEMLDDDEKNRTDTEQKYRYEMGGNYAFFLQTKYDTGAGVVYADNNEAGRILQREYNEAFPGNQVTFDTEMSHCFVYAPTRDEARQFMVWMNEKYFKPWVEANLDGWDDFVKVYDKASKVDQMMFQRLMFD